MKGLVKRLVFAACPPVRRLREERDHFAAVLAERYPARRESPDPVAINVSTDAIDFKSMPPVTGRDGKPILQPPLYLFPAPHLFLPLNVRIDPSLASRPHLNILLPSTRAMDSSGGPNTAYILAAELVRAGVPLRIVAVNTPIDRDSSAIRAHIARLSGAPVELVNAIELADGHDRGRALPLGENDVFLATAWWTAQMLKYLLPRFRSSRFAYLIQDYEPNLHPISSNSVLALETYDMDYLPVVNSRLLYDHFVTDRVGRFANPEFTRAACWLEPSVDRELYHPTQNVSHPGGKRRLLFYTRPGASRNLFELGIAALMHAIAEGTLKPEEWEFHATLTGIEGACPRVRLSSDGAAILTPLPLQQLSAWAVEMQRTDVLLSLIWSPHTSYPPLEAAACGALVVTNTCGVKTAQRLHDISPNILGAVPTIEGIAKALATAALRTGDWTARVAGASLGLPATWQQSFQPVLPRLLDFLQAEGISPSTLDTDVPRPSTSPWQRIHHFKQSDANHAANVS